MIQGLYAAATGLMSLEDHHSVIANNIANASTAGFRRQNTIQRGFYEAFLGPMRNPAHLNVRMGPGGGVRTEETYTDVNPGAIMVTGDPLNIALSGPGYLAVETSQGERFTRNGKLALGPQGELMTEDGHRVQNASGAGIAVQGGRVEIDEEGRVLVDGRSVGQIRLVEFEDPHMLTREGHNLYAASDAAKRGSSAAADTRVVPESLESSNVQLPYEMVNMMLVLRAYAANQNVINAVSETASRLIDQVGAPV